MHNICNLVSMFVTTSTLRPLTTTLPGVIDSNPYSTLSTSFLHNKGVSGQPGRNRRVCHWAVHFKNCAHWRSVTASSGRVLDHMPTLSIPDKRTRHGGHSISWPSTDYKMATLLELVISRSPPATMCRIIGNSVEGVRRDLFKWCVQLSTNTRRPVLT